ncbi:MAG: four-helix bundle copper-binding protein [Chitinophagaceae bacterium]
MPHEHYKECIEACQSCAAMCNHCAAACLQEKEVAHLAKCI